VNAWWWSWLLTAVGVFGLWLGGRRNYWGWFVGLMAQVLWMSYAVVTSQYGFMVSALAYGWVYGNNFVKWRTEARAARIAVETCDHSAAKSIIAEWDGPPTVFCDLCGVEL